MEPVTDPPPARRRRRRGGWVALLVILLVLGVVVVVGDRVAARFATTELQAQLVAELDARGVRSGSTEVNIAGVPFLTQVARGKYDKITIDLTDVALDAGNGKTVTLPTLNVVATGVAANTSDVLAGTANVVADQVSGSTVVSYTTLETLVDYSQYSLSDVTFAESAGGVQITATAQVAGARVPISATAEVSAVDGQLAVKLRDAKAVGLSAPAPVRDYLTNLVQDSLAARLPQLPFGLTLESVAAQPDGLAIAAIGQNVTLVS